MIFISKLATFTFESVLLLDLPKNVKLNWRLEIRAISRGLQIYRGTATTFFQGMLTFLQIVTKFVSVWLVFKNQSGTSSLRCLPSFVRPNIRIK